MRDLFASSKKNHKITSHTLLKTNDNAPQKNTRLDIRKTPIDETEKSPRESKYSKDNTKNTKDDPYPWLDENGPRRHITDKEILKSTMDLSEACITEMQKQDLYKILLQYR